MKSLADNREYLMKSSLINFVEKYRDRPMAFSKLKSLWKLEIDKNDFDKNEDEVFLWFQDYRKNRLSVSVGKRAL